MIKDYHTKYCPHSPEKKAEQNKNDFRHPEALVFRSHFIKAKKQESKYIYYQYKCIHIKIKIKHLSTSKQNTWKASNNPCVF